MLQYLGKSKDLNGNTLKAQETKANTDKWDYVKQKGSRTANKISIQMWKHTTEWKIFCKQRKRG